MQELERIREIVSPWLHMTKERIKELGEDDLLTDYGLNSLGAMEMVVAIEDAYGIEIEDDDLMVESLDTLGKLVVLIDRYLSEQAS